MDQYAVMGNPIAHSLSPAIHRAFAAQSDQQINYQTLLVEEGEFAAAVEDFFSGGGKGLNITVPFKLQAWELAEVRSADAESAGAVNTLFKDESGRLQGHNTDGIGLIRDIKNNHEGSLQGKDILILGAGGATRGILLPILREEPASVSIANRTHSKAEALALEFASRGNIKARAMHELAELQIDWLINASSASLYGELPELPASILREDASCYDLMYGKQSTPFCQWARQTRVAHTMDGLGMLVEQAAEAFLLWRGVRPRTRAVIQSLR